MASYEYVDYGSDDGAIFGRTSTEKIAFYGATPIARYGDVGAASTYITMRQSTATASTTGLNTDAAMSSLVSNVSTLIVAMRNLGLIT
jgi:hypothetical protein